MAQQTAVEWLQQAMKSTLSHEQIMAVEGLYQQALAMEKEQHEMMFNCGRQYQLTGEGTFKQTHEELYGK